MDQKKIDVQFLLIYIAVGIVVAAVTAWALYQNRTEYWRAQACKTFQKALIQELQKRDTMDVFFLSSGTSELSSKFDKDKKESVKRKITSEFGEKEFIIPYEKYKNNIESTLGTHGMYSYVLAMDPLKADSLNVLWEKLMAEKDFFGRTMVRTSVSDWREHETYAYSADSLSVQRSDSIVSYYLGLRSEIGVTGYIYYPWWKTFSLKDVFLLSLLIIGCCLLFFIQEYFIRLYHRLFVKQVSTVILKEVPVIAADKTESHIYKMDEDLLFDAGLGMLKRMNNPDEFLKLMPQGAKLLQGFLDAEKYTLSVNEILDLLWKGDKNAQEGRVHTAIKRLRENLLSFSGWTIVNITSAYQLRPPASSRESSL